VYWYNPKTRKMEEISTPKTDAGAIEMLDGVRVSVEFIAESLRRTGETFQMVHQEAQPPQ
jgi:hypothetical protein